MPENQNPSFTECACCPGFLWPIVVHHRISLKNNFKGCEGQRTKNPRDNLQLFTCLFSCVLESKTLHWPDPKFREIPHYPLFLPLKISRSFTCPARKARQDTKEESSYQEEPEGGVRRVTCSGPIAAGGGWSCKPGRLCHSQP
jgi:hypothetical protein